MNFATPSYSLYLILTYIKIGVLDFLYSNTPTILSTKFTHLPLGYLQLSNVICQMHYLKGLKKGVLSPISDPISTLKPLHIVDKLYYPPRTTIYHHSYLPFKNSYLLIILHTILKLHSIVFILFKHINCIMTLRINYASQIDPFISIISIPLNILLPWYLHFLFLVQF